MIPMHPKPTVICIAIAVLTVYSSYVSAADACMVSPTEKEVVSGRFGKFRGGGDANSGSANKEPHMHDGLDFSTSGASAPLFATTDGVITFIGSRGTAGNTILIKRNSGDVVAYYHMSGFAPGLQQGSVVKAGQNIGLSGNTPSSSMTKHLHFVYGTSKKDEVRAASFPANASQGVFNPGQLANVFNQQVGIGWKTDPTMYFCKTYPIQDGHPEHVPLLGGDTYAQHKLLFESGSVKNDASFDAQQVVAANADIALAAAGASAIKIPADTETFGSLPSPPLGGYETMSTSEMITTEAMRRFSDADWNTNIPNIEERGLWVDYVRIVGVSNFIANATLRKKERVEALLALYTSMRLNAARGNVAQNYEQIQVQQLNNKIAN